MAPGVQTLARAWRLGRWALVGLLLPAVVAIQLTLALVYLWPFDRGELVATTEPLVLVDVRGEEIARLPAKGADTTHWVQLGEIPSIAVSAVVESEDARFWDHRGIDGLGVARAVWLNLRGGRYGASTLTMQVARMLISPGAPRTVTAKARESVLALRIERAVDKRTILEQWMNRAYFGNGAVGIDAAARLYFGKPASALSDGEALLLAIIPRAPTGYDPLQHRDAALRRRDYVAELLVRRGVIDTDTAARIRTTPLAIARHVPDNHAPHFVAYALDQLPPEIRARGGRVQTTLDLQLQRVLQRRVAEQVAQLHALHLQQAGVVVLDTETTGVRAMVGSTGWTTPGGQINLTTRRRHPGSALKPFVYATAIERGETPASIAWDVRDTTDQYFAPSGSIEHGPVRYREALASSYNFAAVDVLDQIGVPRLMTVLDQAGVAALDGAPEDYGLRLALGAAKVRLVDLTAGYGFLVKDGKVGRPRAIASVTTADGTTWTPPRPIERRVFSPSTAWLTMDMLADPEARRPGFGMELPLDLPFRVAAKTGTARGFADTWTVGATNEVLVGAWAGSIDGAPTQGIVGMDAAAPLVRDALLAIANGRKLTLPARPDDIVPIEVCEASGMAPPAVGATCPTIHDWAQRGHAPIATDTWYDAAGKIHYPARADGWLSRTGGRKFAHALR
ncbi:MAG TPA: transglycosylase domain-containing protein [Kofleriaceae bacterium]|nr:transglycosylase domain-containing protein [Kofleriaceae bacterium]